MENINIDKLSVQEKDTLVNQLLKQREKINEIEDKKEFKSNPLDTKKLTGINKILYDFVKETEESVQDSELKYRCEFTLKHLHVNEGDYVFYYAQDEQEIYKVKVKEVNFNLKSKTLVLILESNHLNDGKAFAHEYESTVYDSGRVLITDQDIINHVKNTAVNIGFPF